MRFGERHSQLLPFCEYVFVIGKSPVEVQPEMLDIFLLRKVYAVYVKWRAGLSSCDENDMDRRNIPEDAIPHIHRRENLKSYVIWTDLDSLAFIIHLFIHFYSV
jgi:hypothetical protein